MKKRHTEHRTISEVLKDFVSEHRLEDGLDKIDARDAWIKIMGSGVNTYTTNVILKNDTLYVSLSSAVLREELSYGKEKIIRLLNESLGKELIQNLVLR
ncbi:DUF721 domain-containing protein [Kordia algicida OT-1]|uniref:DUF721 domain-containing protein n=1 Tax=Kordia algicida OT-1 TaxID=391587 RepID=A9ECM5_9FLAO|nr:DUF721 domain-containing protein [Kordia algicida]EDP94388.1 hypothetical protein KAOT1_10076 [Kordia algicida OT-1]